MKSILEPTLSRERIYKKNSNPTVLDIECGQ